MHQVARDACQGGTDSILVACILFGWMERGVSSLIDRWSWMQNRNEDKWAVDVFSLRGPGFRCGKGRTRSMLPADDMPADSDQTMPFPLTISRIQSGLNADTGYPLKVDTQFRAAH